MVQEACNRYKTSTPCPHCDGLQLVTITDGRMICCVCWVVDREVVAAKTYRSLSFLEPGDELKTLGGLKPWGDAEKWKPMQGAIDALQALIKSHNATSGLSL